ncbi:hypothetical protein JMG10_03070 [Nostoc ellipsosporum NOK]|nr:hypothetical protein [Nostoc ellipsosporum NOK]
MFIGAGSFAELAPFIQVTLWIGLPVAAIVAIITIWWHYRQKRHHALQPVVKGKHAFFMPVPGLSPQAQQFLFVDHSGLVRRQQRQLSLAAARHTVLQSDYRSLQEKYTVLITSQNILSMQHSPAHNTETTATLFTDESLATLDRDALLQKLHELNSAFQTLERENAVLQARNHLSENNEGAQTEEQWKEERVTLLTRLAEQAYLKDLMEEKTLQLSFLQQQLEERIRRYHQAAQSEEQAVAELTGLRAHQAQLEEKIIQLQEQRERQLAEAQLWQDERNRLEASTHSLTEGYENQQQQLKNELEQLRTRVAENEQQLAAYRQLIQDIGRMAGSLNSSPVIAMQAVH